jgi:hypothetical protein
MLGVAALLVADLSGSPLPWQVQSWTPQLILSYGGLLVLGLALIDSYRLTSLWQPAEEDLEERVYPGKRFDFLGITRPAKPDEPPPGIGVFSSWVGGFTGWLLGGWWWQRKGLTDRELMDLKSKELRNGRLAM